MTHIDLANDEHEAWLLDFTASSPTTAIRHQIEPDPAEMAAQRGDKVTNGVSPTIRVNSLYFYGCSTASYH